VRAVTGELDAALRRLTINAPDWDTVRALDAVRRLYQPTEISIGKRVELARRFNTYYTAVATDPLDGLTVSGAGPWGNPKKSGYLNVYDSPGSSSAKLVGRLPLVPVRWYEQSGALTTVYSTHDFVAEFWRGRFMQPWYLAPDAFYKHDFMNNLYGIVIPTSSLGGAGQGTTPMWPGWQELRRLSIETDGINSYGRTIVVWDWMENVATQPGGVR